MNEFSRKPNAIDQTIWSNPWSILPNVPNNFDSDTVSLYNVMMGSVDPDELAVADRYINRPHTSGLRCLYCHTLSSGDNCQNCGAPK